MKILMIAPFTGGIDVYVKSLSEKLERLGAKVEIMGGKSSESAYDVVNKKWKSSKEVIKMVENIAKRIPFSEFDIVAFHYGKNDIEQYLPIAISNLDIKLPKTIYFVHFLSRNLFGQYLRDEKSQDEVEKQVGNFFDGYVFFGNFAKIFMEKQYHKHFDGIISYLPETHSFEEVLDPKPILTEFQYNFDLTNPTVYLPGFAANYKDHELLLSAFKYVEKPMNFVFAGLGWRKRLGFEEKKINKVMVRVVDKYLNSKEYHILTNYSLFGIFPYRQPAEKGEYFQGSGTLPNFIYAHKACIVLDEGSMSEYVGKAGITIKNNSAMEIGKAINKMLDPTIRINYEKETLDRVNLFSLDEHATRCLEYFQKLVSSVSE